MGGIAGTKKEEIMIKMISSSYDISDIKYITLILENLREKKKNIYKTNRIV